jgi:UDP-3-O-[3-hydroxymyristoyl] glucosamine N-acyltransferase
VQIAHNVKIGYGSLIAGCAAIAGSTEIGKFVQIGGNSSIAGHIKINDFAKIAGMSGVIRDVAVKSTIGGAPAIDIRDFHRLNVRLFEIAKSRNYKNNDIGNCKFTKFYNFITIFYKIISKFTKKILQFIRK